MNGVSDTEFRSLLLSVGTHRSQRPLSPVEVAELLRKVISTGTSRVQCAAQLGISPSQVSAFLNLLEIDPRVRHLADWQGSTTATIAFSTMAELRRLSADDQVIAVEAALAHKLTWKEAVQLTQITNRSGEPIEECVTKVLKLRPEIITRHLFVGAVTSSEARALLERNTQRDRDNTLTKILRKLTGPDYQTSARLSSKGFTILSDHNLPRILNMEPNDIETFINNGINEELG